MRMRLSRCLPGVVLGVAPLLGGACASSGPDRPEYHYFEEAARERDPWFRKVEAWQQRARRDRIDRVSAATTESPSFQSDLLRRKMAAFEADEKRALAHRISDWARLAARRHYRAEADENPANDHWPTVKELLERNGDDCDGLDLVAYQLLREFGFPQDEVYRAIVRRQRDGANHMVTLWFEDREDPWVLDVTGAISLKMRRFSELPGWRPTKVFNEREQFTVVEKAPSEYSLVRE